MNKLNKLIDFLLSILYPRRCPYCQKLINHNELHCKQCDPDIPKLPISQGIYGGYKCTSALIYKDKFKRAVIRFKFKGKKHYSKQFAPLMYNSIETSYPDMIFDYITYVPMHKKALRKRGYNQCELLAKELSQIMGIPCVEALIKTKHTSPQHSLSPKERRKNLIGAFKADKAIVRGRCILLIDDIVTTGSTLSECAKALQKCKPAHICCATLLTSR